MNEFEEFTSFEAVTLLYRTNTEFEFEYLLYNLKVEQFNDSDKYIFAWKLLALIDFNFNLNFK